MQRSRLASATTAAALLIGGCTSSDDPATAPSTEAPAVAIAERNWLEAVEAVRQGLRTSPDHYPARMAALIEAKDEAGIIELVASLQPVPPFSQRQLHGPRGALRGGYGSGMDLAALLAESLVAIGLDAEVVHDPGVDTTVEDLFRPRRRPAATFPAELDDLLTSIGGVVTTSRLPEIEAMVASTTELLLDAAQDEVRAQDWPTLISMPWVAVGGPSGRRLIDPTGIHPMIEDRGVTPASWNPTTVDVELFVEHADDPFREISLLKASLPSSALSGRWLDIGFVPPVASLDEHLLLRPSSVTTFTPVLSLGGTDLTEEERLEHQHSGVTFDLAGNLAAIEGVEVAALPRSNATLPEDDVPSALVDTQDVSAIDDVTADPGGFPRVEVSFAAMINDAVAEGLTADQIELREDGLPTSFRLERSWQAPPRVLFLADGSSSIPEAYLGEANAAFTRSVAEQVLAALPNAQFSFLGSTNDTNSPWTTDLDVLAAAANHRNSGSPLWEDMLKASRSGASAIVFVTDAQPNDVADGIQLEPRPDQAARLRTAPSTVVVLVGDDANPDVAELMADLTNGEVLLGADPASASTEIATILGRQAPKPVELSYRAPIDGPPTRTVEVTVGDVTGSTTYTVPEQQLTPPGYSGLYLRIDGGQGADEVVRTVAGRPWGSRSQHVEPEHLVQVQRAMFGRLRVHGIGGPPSLTTLLDDQLGVWHAIAELQSAEGDEAILDAHRRTQGPGLDAVALMAELTPHDATTATLPLGMQFVVETRRVEPSPTDPERDVLLTTWDIVPSTPHTTVAPDGTQRTELTLERTVRRAALEASVGTITAAGSLGVPLFVPQRDWAVEIGLGDAGEVREQHEASYDAVRAGLHNSWFTAWPVGTPPASALAVDDRTGTVIGLISPGAGGNTSVDDINETFDHARDLADLMGGGTNDVLSILGMPSSVALSFWTSLEKAKIEKLRKATLMLATLSSDPNAGDAGDVLHQTACGVIGDAMGDQGDALLEGLLGGAPVGGARGAINLAIRLSNAANGRYAAADSSSTRSRRANNLSTVEYGDFFGC